jgi:hypothetical protein
MPSRISPCPNCGGNNLYTTSVVAGGGYAPYYLPGLGGFLRHARFDLVACADCGLIRFFAEPEATAKIAASDKWTKLP